MLFDNRKIYFFNKNATELFKSILKQNKKNRHSSIFEFLRENDRALLRKRNNLILKGVEVEPIEFDIKQSKGAYERFEITTSLAIFQGQKVIQAIFRPVTHEVKLRAELETNQQLLQRISDNQISVIFDYSFLPVPKLNFVSKAASQLLGFQPEELYKNPLILRSNVHKDDQKYLIAYGEGNVALNKYNNEKTTVVRFKMKKGEWKHLEIIRSPIFNSKRQLSGIVGLMRDATERIETERLLIETKEKFDLITNNGNDIITFYTFNNFLVFILLTLKFIKI
jgi:PAS domain S-box-containing protein